MFTFIKVLQFYWRHHAFCHYLLYLLLSNMNILIGGLIIVNINIMVQIKHQYPLWLTFVYYSILTWRFKGEESKEGCSLCYLNCFCFEKDSKPLIQLCSDKEYIATFTPQLWIEMSVFLASGCSFSELNCCPLLFNIPNTPGIRFYYNPVSNSATRYSSFEIVECKTIWCHLAFVPFVVLYQKHANVFKISFHVWPLKSSSLGWNTIGCP